MLIEMDSIIALRACYVKALYKHCPKKRYTEQKFVFSFFSFVFYFYFIFATKRKPHRLYYILFRGLYTSVCMVCLPNVSTRPITIHADMFAVYWNDALRTAHRKRLPDSVAAAVAVDTNSMALGWFERC